MSKTNTAENRAVDTAPVADGIIEAINRVQAVIEFELDGTIITANENFLSTLGYSLQEIQGKHHRIFCCLLYTSDAADE